MILTETQRDLARWYFAEGRTISEIAEWRHTSYGIIRNELGTLRAIFASHGQELPRYNHGRPRTMPNLPETAVA